MTEANALRDRHRSDYLAAMVRLRDAANDLDERRRALSALMGELYVWREFERKCYAARHDLNERKFKHLGDLTQASGDLVEALVLWRDVATHHSEQLVELREYAVFPGEDVYPSEWLCAGRNLCIVSYDEAPRRVLDDMDRRDYFRNHVAGKPLLPLLARASAALDAIANA